jgi:hypothetical protein
VAFAISWTVKVIKLGGFHSTKTFEDEYRAFLKKYNVEYDEKYLWQ